MGIFKKTEKTKPAKKAAPKKEAAVKVVEKTEKPKTSGVVGNVVLNTIVRPLVTEKAAVMQGARTYSFVVKSSATKPEVAKAIKEMYGVTPEAVRMINVQGHRVRFGKNQGKRSDYKKAMVTLKQGDSITIHEGV